MSCSNCAAKALINIDKPSDELIDNGCGKLKAFDWLNNLPDGLNKPDLIEVQFKNTRKEFFSNTSGLELKQGNYVAVSANPGHDVGRVSLTGKLALMQMQRKNIRQSPEKQIYRIATPNDIEKLFASRKREKPVLIEARQLAKSLNLEMKISDIEFQADGTKAIFYYIADSRVDFRELIKLYAKAFKIRVEMRQIGARQEAAMVGGIGSCGNELCCSSWRSNLDSVSANAARIQELPHNIQKLTGQCGKLKCCLMYELDNYLELQNDFPDILLELETTEGIAYPKKKEVLKKVVWYGMNKDNNSNLIALPLARVKEIIMLNKKGEKVDLTGNGKTSKKTDEPMFESFENSFDILKKKTGNPKRKFKNNKFKNNPPAKLES